MTRENDAHEPQEKDWRGPNWTLQDEARDTANLGIDCTEAEILAALEWAYRKGQEDAGK